MLKVIDVYCEEKIDWVVFNEMGEFGFLGVILLEEYGCVGVFYVFYGFVVCEIEWVDFGYCLMMSV